MLLNASVLVRIDMHVSTNAVLRSFLKTIPQCVNLKTLIVRTADCTTDSAEYVYNGLYKHAKRLSKLAPLPSKLEVLDFMWYAAYYVMLQPEDYWGIIKAVNPNTLTSLSVRWCSANYQLEASKDPVVHILKNFPRLQELRLRVTNPLVTVLAHQRGILLQTECSKGTHPTHIVEDTLKRMTRLQFSHLASYNLDLIAELAEQGLLDCLREVDLDCTFYMQCGTRMLSVMCAHPTVRCGMHYAAGHAISRIGTRRR